MLHHRPLALLLALATAARPAWGWISHSQQRYGVSIADINRSTYGQSTANAYHSLGWLWTTPRGSFDSTGLGGAITWALDPALCASLLPHVREEVWSMKLVGCADIAHAVHRAFAAWEVNHPRIRFIDVTQLCDADSAAVDKTEGGAVKDWWSCSHAEVVITLRFNASALGAAAVPAGIKGIALLPPARTDDDVTTSVAYGRISNLFRFSNGEAALMVFGNLQLAKQTVEVVGGRIELGRLNDPLNTTCWYLDSAFCAPLTRMQRDAATPEDAYASLASTAFSLWGLLAALIAAEFLRAVLRRARSRNAKYKAQLSDDERVRADNENLYWRTQAVLGAAGSYSVFGTFLRIFLLIVPWALYLMLLRTCFDCFDLELVIANQIGRILGLDHPDTPPGSLLLPEYAAKNPPGNNSYNARLSGHLASSSPAAATTRTITVGEASPSPPAAPLGGGALPMSMGPASCRHVWDGVRAGVPPGAVTMATTTTGGGLMMRPALMETVRTALAPDAVARGGACLLQDDYEGLLTLYPVCDIQMPTTPVCPNAPLRLGLMRLMLSLLLPLAVALVAAPIVQFLVRGRFRSLDKQTNGGLGTSIKSVKSLVPRAGTPTAPGGGGGGGSGGGGGGRGGKGLSCLALTSSTALTAAGGGDSGAGVVPVGGDDDAEAAESVPRRERLGMALFARAKAPAAGSSAAEEQGGLTMQAA